MKTATIFNTQRFSIHDGPGIRTVIFFKGCPLKCLWCANPESQSFVPELEVLPKNCIGCGECMKACPQDAIYFDENGIHIRREVCRKCGRCASECYSRTLKYVGEQMTVSQVVAEIKKDEVFYRNSGGGVTFSGGEPLAQGEFCIEVLRECSASGIHSAVETSGHGDRDTFIGMAKELDLIFFDIKHSDPNIHRKLTGVTNDVILDNLRSIQPYASEIIVRTPVIPGLNDDRENIARTAAICSEMSAVSKWELLPYHNLGEHKYDAIGKAYDSEMFSKPDGKHMSELMEIANRIMKPAGKYCTIESSGM